MKPASPDATCPPQVLRGEDGWLFWIGRPGIMAAMYGRGLRIGWRLLAWSLLTAWRARRARTLGARFVEFIVPDKFSVYGDGLSRRIPSGGSPARRIGRRLPGLVRTGSWIDGCGAFRAARRDGPLYFRTDTHWTTLGYRLGYTLLCRACGVEPSSRVMSGAIERRRQLMDVGSKCSPPVDEEGEIHRFERRARRTGQNELVDLQERATVATAGIFVGSRITYANDDPQADPRRVLIFGDSFTFHETGLGAMLAESFREVHLVWSSSIDWGIVRRTRPDVLVHEIAERFLWRVPTDTVDIDRLAADRASAARRGGEA